MSFTTFVSSSGHYRLCISGPVQIILYFLTSVLQMMKALKFFSSQKSNSSFPDGGEIRFSSYWPGLNDLCHFILSGGHVSKGHSV